ncbi:DNA-directed RNA polymerase subunit beta [Candidatus Nasuia deltocephalinicola str. NAS-ALF]|uniref:DNA-directed RNA polymerase n=1 Tax=Candidatus Nasuia deltocephalinicola str. NAS-ALF TaxID=1343077 RepID=S5SXY8_9PROT|nr:DNA-directed RNA polymerase subunit beta [Candidatus Nasuia deltocephalinicola str. NAS-ALF]
MNKNIICLNEELSGNYFNKKQSEKALKNFNLLYIFFLSYKNFLKNSFKKIIDFIFPLFINKNNVAVYFNNYNVLYPLKSPNYCINNGITYSISIKLNLSLYKYEINPLNSKILKTKISDEEIIIPNIPYITNNFTFIINGIEKTIVSKFVRSPGLYFLIEKNRGKKIYILKIVPDIGDEIDFIIDNKNEIYLKYRKFSLKILNILKVGGLNNEEIINEFYNYISAFFINKNWKIFFNRESFLNFIFPFDILDENNNVIIKKNTVIENSEILKITELNINYINIPNEYLIGKNLYFNIYYQDNKIFQAGQIITKNVLKSILEKKINKLSFIIYNSDFHKSILNDLNKISFFNSIENVNNFLNNLKFNIFDFNIINNKFSNFKKYFCIYPICRKKINFYLKKNYNFKLLTLKDLINILKLIISFKDELFKESDKLSLSNLNLIMIGDTFENIFLNFFLKLKSSVENGFFDIGNNYTLNSVLKIYILVNEIKDFFNMSKYCQYLDKVNILSEISHKRRVTFLGVIGISKKYSGFDSRDLNSSHYSRVCPIETPEGINIGLVNSLALLCSVDKYKFLIAPYYKIINGKITKKWKYLSVEEEFNSFIAEPTIMNYFESLESIDLILAKYGEQILFTNFKLIKYINILPYQMLSISTILIPFLENNDSNRALMASNMLRQALPLSNPEKPKISTGFENLVAKNSGTMLICKNKGIYNYSDSRLIILKNYFIFNNNYYYNYDIYFLIKYLSSNQKTNISQSFVGANKNEKFFPGDVISDGSCTNDGVLSLGKNLLTVFMCWEGYNFEDSIIISEKIVKDEKYTSLDLTQIDININNISNNSEVLRKGLNGELLNNINSFGIIKTGAKVHGGDIIVEKLYPVFDDFEEINPNHRILHSIFLKGDLNSVDTSFYLPEKFPSGIVISNEVYFSDKYTLNTFDHNLLKYQIKNFLKLKKKKFYLIRKKIKKMLKNFLFKKKSFFKGKEIIINKKFLYKKKLKEMLKIFLINKNQHKLFNNIKKKIKFFLKIYKFISKDINKKYYKKLSSDICKIVRVFIVSKKYLQVGDKMSGRYGNKGVVSKILPENQMPYFLNGMATEIILNPLGVPSRMNVGQLLEIHMGFISISLSWKVENFLNNNNCVKKIKNLLKKIYTNSEDQLKIDSLDYKNLLFLIRYFKSGFYFSIKPFNSYIENNIEKFLNIISSNNFLKDEYISWNKKQTILRDGRSGENFENPSTIGLMYIFKLNHLAEEKIHARSVGPYSLITQQPLKGKSNLGGQRLGEMEVWAMEAYGAFYSLREMLTIKSDDVSGRFDSYKNIIKGISNLVFNKPETFNVMIKNINCLSLYIRFNDY